MSTKNTTINGSKRKSFTVHLLASIKGPDECWNWAGHVGKNGYAYASYKGKATTAYRASWEHLVGDIPDGYEIDHLCKNPRCVNPKHLEPVTPMENNMRSTSPASLAAKKTHCSNGHPFSCENTKLILRPNGHYDRRCKTCHRTRERERQRLIREARPH